MDSLYQVVYDVRAAGFLLEWKWFSPLVVSLAAFVRLRLASPKGPERVWCALVFVASVGLVVLQHRRVFSDSMDPGVAGRLTGVAVEPRR